MGRKYISQKLKGEVAVSCLMQLPPVEHVGEVAIGHECSFPGTLKVTLSEFCLH
jgi:hypothetical protein